MKTLIISAALTLGCLVSFGQGKGDLQGPAAKNYKPWKDKSEKTTLVTKAKTRDLKGPQAKNAKTWEIKDNNLVAVKSVANKPKGPEAKNQKIWED